jgi:short-subunit dehydrogenase
VHINPITNWQGKRVWIIGASYGIGRELAKQLSNKGAIIGLSGRTLSALTTLREEIGEKNHLILPLDVTNEASIKKAHALILDHWHSLDVIIFAAGVYQSNPLFKFDLMAAHHTLDVQLKGAVNILYHLLPTLIRQKEGQLVLMGSLAGYQGLPLTLEYGASKAALIHMAESLAIHLAPYKISVRIINPGFVKTRLITNMPFSKPFLMDTKQAAKEIIKGLGKKKFAIEFPKPLVWLLKILKFLPYRMYFWLIRKWF